MGGEFRCHSGGILAWQTRRQAERAHWGIAGGGYGIHWPDIDEDLSTEGLLRGARAPRDSAKWAAATAEQGA